MQRAGPRKGAATTQAALGGQGSADLGPLSGDERFRAGATRHAAESLPATGGQGPGSPPAVVSAQEHGVHGAPRSQVSPQLFKHQLRDSRRWVPFNEN